MDEIINDMKNMADLLVPYTYPYADQITETEVFPLKTRSLIVDGYEIDVSFSRAKQSKWIHECVQITGARTPFLPFYLVIKIVRKFLGGHNLSLIEFYKDRRKVYYWSVYLDKKGVPKEKLLEAMGDVKYEVHSHYGTTYKYINSTSVELT